MSSNNGWDTYSKLVLQQLETMSTGIEALRGELQQVQNQLAELKAKEDRVQDLKAWKEKMDDVASPPQLREAMSDIEELKLFKTLVLKDQGKIDKAKSLLDEIMLDDKLPAHLKQKSEEIIGMM